MSVTMCAIMCLYVYVHVVCAHELLILLSSFKDWDGRADVAICFDRV